jgi:Ca2+-binding RTX toxin-like protein
VTYRKVVGSAGKLGTIGHDAEAGETISLTLRKSDLTTTVPGAASAGLEAIGGNGGTGAEGISGTFDSPTGGAGHAGGMGGAAHVAVSHWSHSTIGLGLTLEATGGFGGWGGGGGLAYDYGDGRSTSGGSGGASAAGGIASIAIDDSIFNGSLFLNAYAVGGTGGTGGAGNSAVFRDGVPNGLGGDGTDGSNGADGEIDIHGNTFNIAVGINLYLTLIARGGDGGTGGSAGASTRDGSLAIPGNGGNGANASIAYTDNTVTGGAQNDWIRIVLHTYAGNGGDGGAAQDGAGGFVEGGEGTTGASGSASVEMRDNAFEMSAGDDNVQFFIFGNYEHLAGEIDTPASFTGNTDTVDGGSGYDTVWYDGNRADFQITIFAGVLTVSHNGYSQKLTHVEALKFQDQTVTTFSPPSLFDDQLNVVDFNNLTSDQVNAIVSGAQLLNAGGGDDVVTLPNISGFQLTGGVRWDAAQTFLGGANDDQITGGDADDTINGGDGNDIIYGAPATKPSGKHDTIYGGGGNDRLYADVTGSGFLVGGANNDKLIGGNGDDVLSGGSGKDRLQGYDSAHAFDATGRNVMNGGAGNDTIVGGVGSDLLIGGSGADLMTDIGGGSVQISFDPETKFKAEKIIDRLSGSIDSDTFIVRDHAVISDMGLNDTLYIQKAPHFDEFMILKNADGWHVLQLQVEAKGNSTKFLVLSDITLSTAGVPAGYMPDPSHLAAISANPSFDTLFGPGLFSPYVTDIGLSKGDPNGAPAVVPDSSFFQIGWSPISDVDDTFQSGGYPLTPDEQALVLKHKHLLEQNWDRVKDLLKDLGKDGLKEVGKEIAESLQRKAPSIIDRVVAKAVEKGVIGLDKVLIFQVVKDAVPIIKFASFGKDVYDICQKTIKDEYHNNAELFADFGKAVFSLLDLDLAGNLLVVGQIATSVLMEQFLDTALPEFDKELTDLTHTIGTADNDTIDNTNSKVAQIYFAGDGDDVVRDGSGNSTFIGGSGNGDDKYFGGKGIDEVVYYSTKAGLVVSLAKGTATGTEIGHDHLKGIENVSGGGGSDTIVGDGSRNVLKGESGDDRLSGKGGNDVLMGGHGNDVLDGGTGNDTTDYSDAIQGIHVDLNLTSAQQVGEGRDTLISIENLTGSAFNDHLTGDSNANVLTGGPGDDTLQGNGGADTLDAGDGADELIYVLVSDSTGADYDTVRGFDFDIDNFDLPSAVTAIAAPVNSGALNGGTFDLDLSEAIGSEQLAAGSALIFTPDGGSLQGAAFLIVDANGRPGYQSGQDFIMRLAAPQHVDDLNLANFV